MKPIIGEYYCKLDNKGRLLVPSGLRKQLPEGEQEEFVLNRGLGEWLMMYPVKVWEKELEKIQALNPYVQKNIAFKRMFLNGATPVAVDGNDRILLPKRLVDSVGVQQEVVLVGQIDRIEIWDKEKYEAWMNKPGYEFEKLAEEVMTTATEGETE